VNLLVEKIIFSPRLSTILGQVHKLRHSCASALISQKVDALVVKEVLGHSQVSLTLSVYAHLFPGADRVAASAMDAAFGG